LASLIFAWFRLACLGLASLDLASLGLAWFRLASLRLPSNNGKWMVFDGNRTVY